MAANAFDLTFNNLIVGISDLLRVTELLGQSHRQTDALISGINIAKSADGTLGHCAHRRQYLFI
jgi:hypothetical protein